jgi:hypothetical protein
LHFRPSRRLLVAVNIWTTRAIRTIGQPLTDRFRAQTETLCTMVEQLRGSSDHLAARLPEVCANQRRYWV